jgi:hypothetical protein
MKGPGKAAFMLDARRLHYGDAVAKSNSVLFPGLPLLLLLAILAPAQAQFTDAAKSGARTSPFGFRITGASNLVVVVEGSARLANPAWYPLQTNTLEAGSFCFSDPRWTNYPSRFYRVRSPSIPSAVPYRPNCFCTFNDYWGYPPSNMGNYYQAYLTNLAAVWKANGTFDAGFQTFWLDDGWQATNRDVNGNLQADAYTITNGGIPALTSYLHGLGYKVVLYTAYAPSNATTCEGFPGTSDATLQQDVDLFAAWGVDGIMFDACGGATFNDLTYTYARHEFASISNALANVAPPHEFWVHLSIPVWPLPPETPFYCNSCGAWGAPSVGGYPTSIEDIVSDFRYIAPFASLWDSDSYFLFGECMGEENYNMSPEWLKVQMTMSALAGSELRPGGGITSPYLTNAEVIATISDPYAKCGTEVYSNDLQEIFVRPLGFAGSGTNLIGIYNAASTNQTVVVRPSYLGFNAGPFLSFRDLWAKTNVSLVRGNLTVSVPPTDVMLFMSWPSSSAEPLLPAQRQ